MIEGAGYVMKGMAPTGEAAKKLQAESGIESHTIDSFLHKRETRKQVQRKSRRTKPKKKEFWVLDEASLANAQHFHDVMKAAREDNARVLFQGDIDQLGSVEWGKIFSLLIEHGMCSVEM
ncbi:AAA family ATPase, partial [Vibrio anguillarum]